MKKIWSKNVVIGFLIFSNVAAFGYILAKKSGDWRARIASLLAPPAQAATSAKSVSKLRGDVSGSSGFKYDNELQACYENFLTREPAVDEGAVLFHWTLTDAGKIDILKLVQSDFADDTFTECLTEKIREAKFSPAKAPQGTIIAHKFKFKRKALDQANF